MNTSNSSSISALSIPGGVVTTQNISTVIKPKENNNSMQFVKIQTPELSKKAVEQIRVAQESKITKDKIKEVEEEWQSNLLNWKSKRRQQFVGTHSNDNQQDEQNNNDNQNDANENARKIKTFAEMIEERTKTGNRLNFHLERYIGSSESDNYESEQDYLDKTDSSVDKEISPPTIHSDDDRIRPSLDVDTKTKEVSSAAAIYEDNGSDHDDEEDEQEEEQKHLQRIAFVAKLKAFEKMTQPSLQEPKFVAPKIIKAPPPAPPPPLAPSRSAHIAPLHQSPTPPAAITPPTRHRQQTNQQQQQQQPPPPPPVPAKVENTPKLEMPTKPRPEVLPSIEPTSEPQANQEIPSPKLTKQQSHDHSALFPASIQSHDQDHPLEQEPQVQAQPKQPPARKQPPPPIPTLAQSMPTTSSPKLHPRTDSPQVMTSPFSQQSSTELPNTSLPSPILPPSSQRKQIHKPQPPPPPPQPQPQPQLQPQQPPPRHQSQQQQPQPLLKDEKSQDRTVLSVSGKKRCSSCKEELGRGAAAFVIESLNLVYHTNCFRCSVCHVNLSNGFRGVDVRVHAGALHCQNCYSRDGLNYSRV
uniref:LIM and calponin y domains-containing protein 1 n=1 Tax=Aceria tosichella TaxID=561515 RepID=A0A6G1SNP3_9ACAR